MEDEKNELSEIKKVDKQFQILEVTE